MRHAFLAVCLLAVAGCTSTAGFQNQSNPQLPASQSPMKIWWRFLTETKTGTMPVDAIPVRPLTRAALDALDNAGRIDLALIENGAYDKDWPAVHMTPEESIRAFQDLNASTLYSVHNSTFDLAFHPWREPMDRLAALASARGIDLATPVIGEVLTVGKARVNELWWAKLR